MKSTMQDLNWIRTHAGKLIVGLLIGWMVLCGVLAAAVHYTGMQDNARPADVIIVLGAGIRRNGEANWALTRRSQRGALLWERGIAPYVICTGGTAPGFPRSEAAACRDVLLREGVPSEAIFLEDSSRSTEENALYSRTIMQQQGWQTAMVVSDSYHMFRARILFRTRGIDAYMSPVSRESIRGHPTYTYSVVREIVALHWQFIKDLLGLPITHI